MRARILCTTAMVVLPVATWAQDGLRSASLPERSLSSTPPAARSDLFLAEPDTYVPRLDGPTIYEIPYVFAGGYWYVGDMIAPRPVVDSPGPLRGTRPTRAPRLPHNGDSDVGRVPRSGPADPRPAAAPGIPKTFYVIAGCYAGDTPPRPERLPPDCDPSKVRVIRP